VIIESRSSPDQSRQIKHLAIGRTFGEGQAAEVCRKLGVSEATVHAWKKRYAGLGVAELRRVGQLEDEIAD
jgi:hypothetical protein